MVEEETFPLFDKLHEERFQKQIEESYHVLKTAIGRYNESHVTKISYCEFILVGEGVGVNCSFNS